jgi:hypothetical protein
LPGGDIDHKHVEARSLVFARNGASMGAQTLGVVGSATLTADGPLDLDLRISAEGVSANDASYLRAAEKVSLDIDAKVRVASARTGVCDCSLTVSSGEALWDRFYVDLGRHSPAAHATIDVENDVYRLREAAFSVKSLAAWQGKADLDLRKDLFSASGTFDLPDLGRLIEVAIKEPYKESYPTLAGVEAAGKASGDASVVFDGDAGISVQGRAKISKGELRSSEPAFALHGIELDLPVALATGAIRGGKRQGRITVGSLELLGQRMGRVTSSITVDTNSLKLDDQIAVDLYGGKFTVAGLAAHRILDGARVETAVTLNAIDIAGFKVAGIKGRADGRLEPIVYEAGRIASEGSLVLDALGGKTEVSKIGITDLLSPVPALGLQVRFSEISLAQLTSAVSVGHVTGVIEGGIDDLVVVKGQPVSMSARVNTVARKGVSQTISVTALNQISVLGGSSARRRRPAARAP